MTPPMPFLAQDSYSSESSGAGDGSFHWATGLMPLLLYGFMLVMAVHAFRAKNWLWLAVMIVMPFGAIWYFLYEYRNNPMRGFELPGAADRARAKRLEGEIARSGFERPDLHLALGELRFRQGKLAPAAEHLKVAREGSPKDADAASFYGQVLLRSGDAKSALPHLEFALNREPRHNYGYTRMAYAEALTACGRKAEAVAQWEAVLKFNEYDRAKVQLAELLLEKNEKTRARELIEEVARHGKHAGATFTRKSDRVWIRRSKSLLGKMK